jgi:type I restriction-modification system DNA methylase subunit
MGEDQVREDANLRKKPDPLEPDRASRKKGGIYYTPSTIVRYIVDHTLGRWLYGTANGRPDGTPLPDVLPKTLADLEGLRLVDPAMGAGAFLIDAFEVLADFYERENARIYEENTARQPALDYVSRILQQHLYGVDLDPEAVEVAGANLILRASERLRGARERQKLSLTLRDILGQTLKVGNALISGVTGPEALTPFVEARRQLIALREALSTLTCHSRMAYAAARAAKLAEIEAVAAPINAALNASLNEYFDDLGSDSDVEAMPITAGARPFNWEIAFPEVFDPDAPEEAQGFTFVVGNPPWGRTILNKEEKAFFRSVSRVDTRHPDTYTLFIELGLERIIEGGYCGYIVPDTLLLKAYPKTRQLMLEAGEIMILRHAGMSFGGVNLDTVIFTLQKEGEPDPEHRIAVGVRSDLSDSYTIPQSLFHSLPDHRFNIYLTPGRLSLYTKLRQGFPRFKAFTETHEGIHTGNIRDKLFVDAREAPYAKPLILGRDEIDRYALHWQGQFVRYHPVLIDRDAGAYASLREERIFLTPKLLVRRTGDRILATLDEQQYYASNNLFCMLLKEGAAYDLRYVLALLNAKLMTAYFRLEVPRVDRLFAELKITHIDDFPFRALNFSDPAEVAAHDALVKLAQRMLDLNETHQAMTDAFAEAVRGYEHRAVQLQRFLTEQRDFITRRPLLDANEEGEANAIAVDEAEDSLVVRTEVEGTWRDVVRLDVTPEDLHLYLLLALRAFLYNHRRKRVWSRGSILRGVLEALEVPRLASATPAGHQRRVGQVLDNVRRLRPDHLPHHAVGLDRESAPLHLGAIEADLARTDAEIDRRVYALYGLTEEEAALEEKLPGS